MGMEMSDTPSVLKEEIIDKRLRRKHTAPLESEKCFDWTILRVCDRAPPVEWQAKGS